MQNGILDDIPSEMTEFIHQHSETMNFNATAPRQSKFAYFNPKHPLKYLKAPKHSVKVQTSKLVQKTRPTTGTTIPFVSSVNAAHYSSNQSMKDSNIV